MKAVVLVTLLVLSLALANTDRKVLGIRARIPDGWEISSPAQDSARVSFYLALNAQNLDTLEAKFWEVSDPDSAEYRNFMSIEEIKTLVAAPKEEVAAVMSWLHHAGVEHVQDLGDALFVKTTVQIANKLFDTTFHEWVHTTSGHKLTKVFGPYSIPTSIASYVNFVEGVAAIPSNARINAKITDMAGNGIVGVSPQTINKMYNVPAGTKATGSPDICVVEFEGQYFDPADLSQFAKLFNVSIPPLTPNHIVGSNDPTNPGVEAELDIQYAAAVAPGSVAWFWYEEATWLYGYSQHIANTQTVPLVNSISYGWSEEDQCDIDSDGCSQVGGSSSAYVTAVNTQFQKIGLRGITLISASGDSGANGRTDESCTMPWLYPAFPAASPYITAVGATEIDPSTSVLLPNQPPGCQGSCGYGSERAVSYDQSSFASGGGFAWYASRPSYQDAAVNAYFKSGVTLPFSFEYNNAGRGFPDVAALGSAVLIYTQGAVQGVGGTSCSSPIFAGLMSMINGYVQTKSGKPLGFLNPLLYKMAAADSGTFTDITVGDNRCDESGCAFWCEGFYCAKGWDPVTGLGTPNYQNMFNYITKTVLHEDN